MSGVAGGDSQQQKVKISDVDWEKKLQSVKPNQDDLNKLVMNYLIIEGFKGGALKFEKEAGVKGKTELDVLIEML